MTLVRPRFYDDFVCIADRCSDNCCIGWEIDIDPVSLRRFDALGGDFGERLRSAIHRGEDVCTFAFGEGERCALLREDGRCELILHEGEDSLCDICALHPRFFGWYNSRKEAGLGLCCEEVCRLLFSDSAPLTFVSDELSEEYEHTCEDTLLNFLVSAREEIFRILQDRTLPFADRLITCTAYVSEVQQCLDNDELALPEAQTVTAEKTDILTAIEQLCSFWRTTESISREWDEFAQAVYERRQQLADSFSEFISKNIEEQWRYEHIAVYFCYRYLVDGVFEGEIVSRFGFAVMSVFAVMLSDLLHDLDGELTEWQRILDLKLYSKQMEYSEENLELAYDAVWDIPQLSPCYISACFVIS